MLKTFDTAFINSLGNKISIEIWVLLILIAGYFFGTSGIVISIALWLIAYKHQQPVQSPPKLKVSNIEAGRFTWVSLESKWIPEILRPEREASGLIWEGFTTGISKENGRVASIAVWFYGSNAGVGHYLYLLRTNKVHPCHGNGHFNLKSYARNDKRWAIRVLQDACEHVAKDIECVCRPLSTSYDEKRKKIGWYDDESGRDVYFREQGVGPSDDFFIFGPYPKKLKNFAGDIGVPGLIVTRAERIEKNSIRIIINAKDIYGQSLKHAHFMVQGTGSSFNYKSQLLSDGESIKISVPSNLQRVTISVFRGGYGALKEEIDMYASDIKVEAILEPLRDYE